MQCLVQDTIETSPFSLVSLAYQGDLRSQGIPSYEALITAHRHKQISALDLVQKVVEANWLSSDLINQEYLKAVENSFLFYYLSHPLSKRIIPVV